MIYTLKVLTGNDLPNGEMDGIYLFFQNSEEVLKNAKIFIEQNYKIEIYQDKEKIEEKPSQEKQSKAKYREWA